MRTGLLQAFLVLVVGLLYWQVTSSAFGTQEPWDAPRYWSTAYPLALMLSAALGFAFRYNAGLTGTVLIFAQFPIMVAGEGVGPLSVLGLVYLSILSVPAVIAAWLLGRFRDRVSSGG